MTGTLSLSSSLSVLLASSCHMIVPIANVENALSPRYLEMAMKMSRILAILAHTGCRQAPLGSSYVLSRMVCVCGRCSRSEGLNVTNTGLLALCLRLALMPGVKHVPDVVVDFVREWILTSASCSERCPATTVRL